jgi:hypothetical protein
LAPCLHVHVPCIIFIAIAGPLSPARPGVLRVHHIGDQLGDVFWSHGQRFVEKNVETFVETWKHVEKKMLKYSVSLKKKTSSDPADSPSEF